MVFLRNPCMCKDVSIYTKVKLHFILPPSFFCSFVHHHARISISKIFFNEFAFHLISSWIAFSNAQFGANVSCNFDSCLVIKVVKFVKGNQEGTEKIINTRRILIIVIANIEEYTFPCILTQRNSQHYIHTQSSVRFLLFPFSSMCCCTCPLLSSDFFYLPTHTDTSIAYCPV